MRMILFKHPVFKSLGAEPRLSGIWRGFVVSLLYAVTTKIFLAVFYPTSVPALVCQDFLNQIS